MLARALLLSASLAFALGGSAVAAPKGSNGNPNSNNAGGNSGGGGGNPGNSNSNGNSNSGSGGATVTPAPLPLCKLSDLGSGASACSGFFQGNLLSQSPADLAAQTQGLEAIGLLDWDGQIMEPQLSLSTTQVDFETLLRGVTFVGIHWGAGVNSPSPHTPGGVTAFYALDAGSGLDTFSLAFGSASGARLYLTQPKPSQPESPLLPPSIETPDAFAAASAAVPEPATWALMILGFGSIGAMLRRRRAAEAAA